jgi:excisionase family DNA binding protein
MTRDVFTPAQAAEYLQICREIVYRLCNNGTIKATKFGGQWRIHKRALDDMLYNEPAVAPSHKEGTCHTNEAEAATGGSLSKEYDKLLARKSTRMRKHLKAA